MKYLNLKNKKSGLARIRFGGACPTKSFRRGFTLVEMMVAIAVFSIVMVTAMSALLNVIAANNKARAIKTAINNVSFALEGISKDMRMGTDYSCIDELNDNVTCSSEGNIGIKYKSPRAYSGQYAYYKFEDTAILECLEKEESDSCAGNLDFMPITSSEVEITKATFYVLGTESDLKQPRMILTLSGKAGKDKIATTFDLQTGISQRTRKEVTTTP
jgi:prepilin-type N-terminal cleavage/methylation domain-containing protein